jgi:hypothetical protein
MFLDCVNYYYANVAPCIENFTQKDTFERAMLEITLIINLTEQLE